MSSASSLSHEIPGFREMELDRTTSMGTDSITRSLTEKFDYLYPDWSTWKYRRTLAYWIAIFFFEGSTLFTLGASFSFSGLPERGPTLGIVRRETLKGEGGIYVYLSVGNPFSAVSKPILQLKNHVAEF